MLVMVVFFIAFRWIHLSTPLFFFSSRRRHTIFKCDWSSHVCSSDLGLQFLPRLEPYGLAGRNRDFFTGARIAPDATLAGLNDKDAKAAQLDTVAARQRFLHRMKQSKIGRASCRERV